MHFKLTDFEQALKKKYTCEVELVHIKEAQDIIDYYQFTLKDLRQFLIGPYMLGTVDSFAPDHFAFDSSVATMANIIDAGFKWGYFTFDDEPEHVTSLLSGKATTILGIPYALITVQHNKDKYLKLLHQLENLRAFL